ncbi:MAG: acetyl-CoA acetyltransferase [Subtercola sp.]|nr:acetyl-CoA acetyltransferase [Subtercola sp.]
MSAFVLGVGQVPFTGPTRVEMGDLGGAAARAAVADAGLTLADIQMAAVGSVYEHPSVGQRVLLRLGINGVPLVNVENACTSGSTAIIEAIRWIESGEADVAIAIGVDKMASHYSSGPIDLVDADDMFGAQGLTVPAMFGLLAEKHMSEFGSTREDFAQIALKNRTYAASNPYARFQKAPTLEEILGAPNIATPLGKFDCCANADGAAAVVLASESFARTHGDGRQIGILSAVLGGGHLGDRLFDDPMTPVSRRAYERAGVGPEDIDVVECHDNFSVAEFEAYERLGFCAPGEAQLYLREGKSKIGGGGAAFNTNGGLLGRGHPAGATGCVQVASVVAQLRGEAGALQHPGAKTALVHTSGGGVMELQSNATTAIVLSR